MKSYLKPPVFLISKVLVFLILLAASVGCNSQTSSTMEQTSVTPEISSPVSTILTTIISTSTSTTNVTLVPVIITSITVEPMKPEILESGATQQFKAIGYYSDGTTKDVSSLVIWHSSDETVATITTNGEVLGVAKISLSDPILLMGISLTNNVSITATLSGITSKPVNLTVTKAPLKLLEPFDVFMKGLHFTDWNPYDEPKYGYYGPPGTDQSLRNLATTGANWISLLVQGSQETILSTEVYYNTSATATDSELQRIIDLAHGLGMRVLLLPCISLSNDPEHWWGQIGTAFMSETQWQEWFVSYREFINHYATFAQASGVDMLYIGSELNGVTHREKDWRLIVKEVRERFDGPISYDSTGGLNGDWKQIRWWDAVDYVAVDIWYPLTNKNNPTLAELKEAWITRGYLTDLENFAGQFNRPIIISEIGYDSKDGANRWPALAWLKEGDLDLQEQADCYQAALEVLWGKPWLRGIFWWQWFAETYTGGPNDTGGTPFGKPAEEVLKSFYLQQ